MGSGCLEVPKLRYYQFGDSGFFETLSINTPNIHVTTTERKGCDSNSAQGTQLACVGNLVSKLSTKSCIDTSILQLG